MPDDTSITLSGILGCKPWEVVSRVESLIADIQRLTGLTEDGQNARQLIDDLIRLGSSHPIARRERLRVATTIAPTPGRFRSAVVAALRRGKPWNLTAAEYAYLSAMPCTDCDGDNGNGIGLDRLDPSRGYEPDNVESCCGPCNMVRQHNRGRKVPVRTRATGKSKFL